MNDLWLCVLVGHLNKNVVSMANKAATTGITSTFNSIVALCECIYPKETGLVAMNK